jgi:putative transcriptional regulator
MAKRNVFGELMEGVAAMKADREGKLTLRSYKIDPTPLPKVDSKLIRHTRKKLRCSRAFLRARCGSTKEPWKNGNRAAPNPIRKPLHSCCQFANTRTRLNGWNEWAGG